MVLASNGVWERMHMVAVVEGIDDDARNLGV